MANKLIDIQCNVKGLAELEAGLIELGARVGGRVLNTATQAGARELAKEIKRRAPVKTGKLKKNIVVSRKRNRGKRKTGEASYVVHIRKKGKAGNPQNAFYGYWVEHGTSKQPAQPFFCPAIEAKRKDAAQVIIDKMDQSIDNEKKKLGFK